MPWKTYAQTRTRACITRRSATVLEDVACPVRMNMAGRRDSHPHQEVWTLLVAAAILVVPASLVADA